MRTRVTRTRHAPRRERGVVAIFMAVLMVVLFGMAALAVDITMQANERQELHDTIDSAAHAGAYELPNSTAQTAATTFATKNDPDSTPTVDFFCIVGSKLVGATYRVDVTHIPSNCNPGPPPYDETAYGTGSGVGVGLRCNSQICAIPCVPAEGDKCNTMRVRDEKPVPFGFANVLGVPQGSTGTLSSVACKGPCGKAVANPIDFVVVGDRTGSMGTAINSLESAIEGLLEYLTPSQHNVAMGTIGRSAVPGNGVSTNTAPANCRSKPSWGPDKRLAGPWIPVGFSNDYDNTDIDPPSSPAVLNPASTLAMAVECMGDENSSTGTYLAAPFRAARQLLTGTCPAAFCRPDLPVRPAPVKKAIIFMTDGEPNESVNPGGGYPYSSDGNVACNNLKNEATTAKAAGILVVTIAFRLEGVRCEGGGSAAVTDVLASVASPRSDGTPSLDDGGGNGSGCNTAAKVAGENTDGDFFFCTPDPSQLEPIFQTAASQISGGVRLLKLP